MGMIHAIAMVAHNQIYFRFPDNLTAKLGFPVNLTADIRNLHAKHRE